MNKRYRKIVIGISVIIFMMLLNGMLFNMNRRLNEQEEEAGAGDVITIGFSQIGAESDWRTANSISMKETFSEEKGYDLIFANAQQKQQNQIMAIRSFIQQEVDYIVLVPGTETGWDTVLREARDVGIPVIVVDRKVDVEDESLYTSWVGADFQLEGEKLCEWLQDYVQKRKIKEVNIAHIQGTIGASAQIGRTEALNEAAQTYGWNIVSQQSGEFTQARAQEVMEAMLQQYPDINVVYCENDNEAFGVIEAIEAAGKTVGPDGDIMVVSFDATNNGLTKVMQGEILVDVECNPLHGPRVEQIIVQLEEGKIPEKDNYVQEEIFAYSDEIPSLEVEGITYKVTEVTEELIRKRPY